MIKLKTKYPIAYDSPDHIFPWGTMRDNSTNEGFINETLEFWKQRGKDKINFLDLGCSGGQLVIDYLNKGHLGVGLEGSDYSVKHKRANWPEYHNKNLFTCDVTKEYKLFENDKQIKFDVITAWEVIEHIKPEDLKPFFKYINDNLEQGGFFCGSISMKQEVLQGHVLHQTVWNEKTWYDNFPEILTGTTLELYDYPFKNKVRQDQGSFHILLLKQ
jgi:cyclopropane fatty-acyl-phospholipid synthase-like methyltransferase